MATHPIEPLSIAEAICARPGMFTASGSFAEVLGVLNGYEIGVRHTAGEPDDTSPTAALDWLADECGSERDRFRIYSSSWVELVLTRFSTESAAFEAMASFLKESRSKNLMRLTER